MTDVAAATSSGPTADKAARPQKPDEAAFKKELEKADKEHQAVMVRFNAVKEKVDLAMPNRSKESNNQSPVQKRRKEILDELGQIRQKQAGFKNARSNRTDQIKRLDEQLKSRIAEQKTARSKVPYKSLEELDNHVRDLNRKVESGSLKLVDEKKALNEISAATRMRKTFTQFDESQKAVDELKAKIKEVKDSGDDPEQRQLSERYTVLQTELDAIKAQSDEAHKNIKSLLAEKDQLNAEQKQSYAAMKKLKDDFYAQKRAHRQFEEEQKQKGRERFRAERERQIQERKKADAERFLEEASNPAFMEEIRRANSLLQFLDPSTRSTEKAPLLADKGLAAQAQRKVDDAGMKGMKLVQKKERDEEYLPAATKKGKKGKKSTGAAEKQKFIIPPSALEDCAFLGVEAPIKSEDIPAVIEKVNEKLASWKENQEAETRKNIEKAKKELERLEKAEQEGENGANGDTKEPGKAAGAKKADDKVTEAASKMENASIADKE